MSVVSKSKDNKSYRDLPLEENVLIEILMDAKKKELEIALSKISSTNETLIWSRAKNSLSKSNRGSRYRGVSKNGKKW
jgi:hypothetical protein